MSGSRGPAGAFLVRSRGEAVMRSLCASKSRRADRAALSAAPSQLPAPRRAGPQAGQSL